MCSRCRVGREKVRSLLYGKQYEVKVLVGNGVMG